MINENEGEYRTYQLVSRYGISLRLGSKTQIVCRDEFQKGKKGNDYSQRQYGVYSGFWRCSPASRAYIISPGGTGNYLIPAV